MPGSWRLGGVSRCRAPRPEDPPAGGAAQGAVVDLRARPRRAESAQADHPRRAVHARSQPRSRKSKNVVFDFAVVDEAQDISVAHLRFFAALGGRSAQRPVLRRRPRPAHLPTAVLVEGARRGYSRALAHPARQLPHLAPNPHAGGPPARPGRDRCGRQQRGPERHGLGVQRPAADNSSRSRARARRSRRSATGSRNMAKAGVLPHEFGVFVRSAAQLDRARAAVEGGRHAVQGPR